MRWREALVIGAIALSACVPAAPVATAPAPTPPAPAPPAVPAPPTPAPPPPGPPPVAAIRSEPLVSVGLLVDSARASIASPGGLELLDASGRSLARVPASATVVVTSNAAGVLSYAIAGGAQTTTTATALTARPGGGAMVQIGGRSYRGSALVRARPSSRVTAINQVAMEDYLLGVVPREIGAIGDTLMQAAKAQAVAARTYSVKYLGRRAALGFDVFATVDDQVYGGSADEHPTISSAVRETRGEILTYAGEPIEAYYHSTCAGQTAAIDEVWNEAARPYLVSVVDVNPATGQAFDIRSSRFRWTTRWPAAQFHEILGRTLRDSLPAGVTSIGEVRDIRVLQRTQSGRIHRMRITTSTAEFNVGKDRIRWIFLTPTGAILNSSKFDVELVRNASGALTEVVATGGGWGHGIGMCQVGAMGRARAGQDYKTILQSYYVGTQIQTLY